AVTDPGQQRLEQPPAEVSCASTRRASPAARSGQWMARSATRHQQRAWKSRKARQRAAEGPLHHQPPSRRLEKRPGPSLTAGRAAGSDSGTMKLASVYRKRQPTGWRRLTDPGVAIGAEFFDIWALLKLGGLERHPSNTIVGQVCASVETG